MTIENITPCSELKCSNCGKPLSSFSYGRPKIYQIGELKPYYEQADPLCKECWIKYDAKRQEIKRSN